MSVSPTKRANIEFYVNSAADWISRFESSPPRTDVIQSLLSNSKMMYKVLEFGCGIGKDAGIFCSSPQVVSYEGVDPVAQFVELAKENVKEGTFHLLDDFDICSTDFNLFYSCGVLPHISQEEAIKMLADVYQNLSSPGYAYFTFLQAKEAMMSEKVDNLGKTYIYFYSPQFINSLLKLGFTEISRKSKLKNDNSSMVDLLLKKT